MGKLTALQAHLCSVEKDFFREIAGCQDLIEGKMEFPFAGTIIIGDAVSAQVQEKKGTKIYNYNASFED
jgi:hypothetical protein